MLGVQNHKIKAFPANANIYSILLNLNLNTSLKRPGKFKFNKGTIATHSTIADRQHRVFSHFSHFSQFLLSVVLALLACCLTICATLGSSKTGH